MRASFPADLPVLAARRQEICESGGQFLMCPLCDTCQTWNISEICPMAKVGPGPAPPMHRAVGFLRPACCPGGAGSGFPATPGLAGGTEAGDASTELVGGHEGIGFWRSARVTPLLCALAGGLPL